MRKIIIKTNQLSNDNGSNFIFLSKTQLAVDPARRQQLEKVAYLNDNSWTHKKFIKSSFRWPSGKNGGRAVMSAVVRLVHVCFPVATYSRGSPLNECSLRKVLITVW